MPAPKYKPRSQRNRRREGNARFNPNPDPTPLVNVVASGGAGGNAALNGTYVQYAPGLFQTAGGNSLMFSPTEATWRCWNQAPGFDGTQVIAAAGTIDTVPASGWSEIIGTGTPPTFAPV